MNDEIFMVDTEQKFDDFLIQIQVCAFFVEFDVWLIDTEFVVFKEI